MCNVDVPSPCRAGEKAPLLIRKRSSGPEEQRGQAGMSQTIINLAKTCAGTGMLALPYACQEGGSLVFVGGLIGIAAWNVYGVQRLLLCLQYVQQQQQQQRHPVQPSFHPDNDQNCQAEARENTIVDGTSNLPQYNNTTTIAEPPSRSSTLGKLAWFAWGQLGLEAMDSMMLILFMGILISYLSGVISFLSDTPLTAGPFCDSLLVSACMAALSMVPDLGYLSRASAIGLVVLAGIFLEITTYGFASHNRSVQHTTNNLWPSSLRGASHFFGICVFGYGVVPLTFHYRESMKEPHRLVEATTVALSLVAVCNCVVGIGILALFGNVTGQMLHELPNSGILPTLTRVAMALVCIMTAPILIVPAGEVLESKLSMTHSSYRVVVRTGICFVAAIIAVLLPSFVQVLAFVGCFCDGLMGFCLPPFLHLRFLQLRGATWGLAFWVDTIMLIFGVLATFIGTALSM